MAQAPMANVTDAAFRRMFAECGKPDVFWTEFVSVEGLLSRGREKLLTDLWFDKNNPVERPIVAQIFGSKPEQFEAVAPLIKELGFDGIDINMGCPDRGVEKSGAGAALIRDPGARKRAYPRAQAWRGWPAGVRQNQAGLYEHRRDGRLDFGVARRRPGGTDRPPAYPSRDVRCGCPLGSGAKNSGASQPDRAKNRGLGNGDVRSLEDGREKAIESSMDGVVVVPVCSAILGSSPAGCPISKNGSNGW